jgi:hypothetical protein
VEGPRAVARVPRAAESEHSHGDRGRVRVADGLAFVRGRERRVEECFGLEDVPALLSYKRAGP